MAADPGAGADSPVNCATISPLVRDILADIKELDRTVIVLPDSASLVPLLSALPEEVPDVNVSIGTIFSIYRRISKGGAGTLEDFLQKGSEQVAAGYVI